MNLKVALIARSTLESVPGGDTLQVFNTMKALNGLGIRCEFVPSCKKIHYSKYQLLHFFNLGRPADINAHAFKSRLPFVVSPIFIDYSEYDSLHRNGISGFIFRCLPASSHEYLKSIGRWVNNSDNGSGLTNILSGDTRSLHRIIRSASMLLPNSNSELSRLKRSFITEFPYRIIPNGIDLNVFEPSASSKRDPLLILCAARIEGIKNQLNLIKALNDSKYKLILVGNAAPNQASYYRKCKQVADVNVEFIPAMVQSDLKLLYEKATIHALPSWFETTGLSSLEAASMGCKLVVSKKGDVYDYLQDDVTYCEPSSTHSILNAIDQAMMKPFPENLRNRIRENFQWDIAALRTRQAYMDVIHKNN